MAATWAVTHVAASTRSGEHLVQCVTHVGHHFQLGDLAVRVVDDAVLRRDLQGCAGRLGGTPAITTAENSAERHDQHVGDDQAVALLLAVYDTDVLAEVGQGLALARQFLHELTEGQVGQRWVQRGPEAGCGVALGDPDLSGSGCLDELFVVLKP